MERGHKACQSCDCILVCGDDYCASCRPPEYAHVAGGTHSLDIFSHELHQDGRYSETLSPEVAAALATVWQSRNHANPSKAEKDAVQRLANAYLRFAVERSRKHRGALRVDDAQQTGALALVEAIDPFDPEKAGFYTFAKDCIRLALLEENYLMVPNVTLAPPEEENKLTGKVERPENPHTGKAKRLYYAVAKARNAKLGAKLYEADCVEIAEKLKLEPKDVRYMRQAVWGAHSLDASAADLGFQSDGEDMTLHEIVQDLEAPPTDALSMMTKWDDIADRGRASRRILAVLNKREREVIELRYERRLTLKKTAAELGKGPTTVRDNEQDAIRKMTKILRAEGFDITEKGVGGPKKFRFDPEKNSIIDVDQLSGALVTLIRLVDRLLPQRKRERFKHQRHRFAYRLYGEPPRIYTDAEIDAFKQQAQPQPLIENTWPGCTLWPVPRPTEMDRNYNVTVHLLFLFLVGHHRLPETLVASLDRHPEHHQPAKTIAPGPGVFLPVHAIPEMIGIYFDYSVSMVSVYFDYCTLRHDEAQASTPKRLRKPRRDQKIQPDLYGVPDVPRFETCIGFGPTPRWCSGSRSNLDGAEEGAPTPLENDIDRLQAGAQIDKQDLPPAPVNLWAMRREGERREEEALEEEEREAEEAAQEAQEQEPGTRPRKIRRAGPLDGYWQTNGQRQWAKDNRAWQAPRQGALVAFGRSVSAGVWWARSDEWDIPFSIGASEPAYSGRYAVPSHIGQSALPTDRSQPAVISWGCRCSLALFTWRSADIIVTHRFNDGACRKKLVPMVVRPRRRTAPEIDAARRALQSPPRWPRFDQSEVAITTRQCVPRPGISVSSISAWREHVKDRRSSEKWLCTAPLPDWAHDLPRLGPGADIKALKPLERPYYTKPKNALQRDENRPKDTGEWLPLDERPRKLADPRNDPNRVEALIMPDRVPATIFIPGDPSPHSGPAFGTVTKPAPHDRADPLAGLWMPNTRPTCAA
jgi:RNA polymerase sigma factor (sigma-70 family)